VNSNDLGRDLIGGGGSSEHDKEYLGLINRGIR
jgi:hypothetical protein